MTLFAHHLPSVIAAAALLAAGNLADAVAENHAAITIEVAPVTAFDLLPVDHPQGTNAAVRLVSLKRAANVDAPVLSTYVIDFEPGGSALLHHAPRPGYVLVHVLSGSIKAEAWHAGVGFYRAGQTWSQTTIASDITSKNATATEPARALVILVSGVRE
jgi:quercetin dioxygenase-like cupin family protein